VLYLVIETFKAGDLLPVYRRFRDHGRLAPEELRYVSSWVTQDFRRCFQVMEAEDPELGGASGAPGTGAGGRSVRESVRAHRME